MQRAVRPSSRFLAAVISVLGAALPASAMTSTFDTGNDNWRVITYPLTAYNVTPTDYGTIPWLSTGGAPGGYVRKSDPDGGDTFALAPAKFYGNAAAAYGSSLTYDLFDTQGNDYNVAAAVVLGGGGLTICFTSPTLPTTVATSFGHFQIPLTESGWALNSYGGTAVTPAQFKTVLANLSLLAVRLEYHYGPDDTGIDNVNFAGLVNPALPGDANGDGRITGDDYTLIDRGFSKHLTGWSNGDFNGDGVVNLADYVLIDTSYAQTIHEPLPADFLEAREAEFGPSYSADLLAAVPEPSSIGLTLAAAAMRARRRRR